MPNSTVSSSPLHYAVRASVFSADRPRTARELRLQLSMDKHRLRSHRDDSRIVDVHPIAGSPRDLDADI